MIELKVGSCYESGEIQDDKNKIVGPMESYGAIFLKDEKGFPYLSKSGEFFDFSDIIYGFGKRPFRDLIKEVPCPIEKQKGKK